MPSSTKLPKWFEGELYKKGDIIQNPYTGEKAPLTAVELSMYDFIKGAQIMLEMGHYENKVIKDFRKGLKWFEKSNPKAYKILVE
tara:strand:+ start:288 stop:542 length:255 start_codon:yes stop_codon:yes gene_type:complete